MARHQTGADGFEPSNHGVKVRCVKPLRHTPNFYISPSLRLRDLSEEKPLG